MWPSSSAGLFRVLALDSLRRRAAVLPGLLDELRPELGRSLGHHNDAIQSSALRLLADLLPRESDQRAGVLLLIIWLAGLRSSQGTDLHELQCVCCVIAAFAYARECAPF